MVDVAVEQESRTRFRRAAPDSWGWTPAFGEKLLQAPVDLKHPGKQLFHGAVRTQNLPPTPSYPSLFPQRTWNGCRKLHREIRCFSNTDSIQEINHPAVSGWRVGVSAVYVNVCRWSILLLPCRLGWWSHHGSVVFVCSCFSPRICVYVFI